MLTQRSKTLNLSTSMLAMSSSQTNLFRDELEDKFFRLKDKHLELKKEANNAENQMKYLNAKLSRLLNEKKRLLNKEKTRREIDLEELIFDLQQRLVQLDRENVRLREKTLVLRTQLDGEIGKRGLGSAYNHIRSRTDSGLGTTAKHLTTRSSSALVLNRRPITTESNVGANYHYSKHKTNTAAIPSFAFNLLQEAQEEIQKLEEVVALQQSHIETLQLQTERLRKITNNNHNNHNMENSLVNTSMTLKTSIDTTNVRQSYTESNGYSQSDSDYKEKNLKKQNQLVNHHSSGKRISDDITNLIEKLQTELSVEKSKCAELRAKLVEDRARHNGHQELEQRIQTLEKENEILKQSLEQCIGSCINEIKQNSSESDSQRDVDYERQLQSQVSDLRSELVRVQNELQSEKSKYQTLESRHKNLEIMYNKVKLQLQQQSESEIKSNKMTNIGNECNRSDHLELSQQLEVMQTERLQLLAEFEDMKQMLQSIENSIISEQ